jgi:hypothetical protein
MVAGECRQAQRGRRAALVKSVVLVEPREHGGAGVARQHFLHRARETEIQHRRQLVDARVPRQLRHVHALGRDLAEDVEVRDAAGARPLQHGRRECLPELRIHVPRGVDAKTIDA